MGRMDGSVEFMGDWADFQGLVEGPIVLMHFLIIRHRKHTSTIQHLLKPLRHTPLMSAKRPPPPSAPSPRKKRRTDDSLITSREDWASLLTHSALSTSSASRRTAPFKVWPSLANCCVRRFGEGFRGYYGGEGELEEARRLGEGVGSGKGGGGKGKGGGKALGGRERERAEMERLRVELRVKRRREGIRREILGLPGHMRARVLERIKAICPEVVSKELIAEVSSRRLPANSRG